MPPAPPPGVQIFQLYTGVLVAQMLDITMHHQIARRLLDGPRTSAELAEATGLHEHSLYRMLRALTLFGVFTEEPGDRFALGPLGDTVARYDDGFPWFLAALNELPRSVETGTPGMELAHGVSLFEYLAQHPKAGEGFDLAMNLVNEGEPQAVAEAYDFTGVRTVVDVGGGNGNVLAALLQRHPHLRGVLFDLSTVIERGAPPLAAHRDRCERVAGNFFESVSEGGDAYVLSHIIHDWQDDRAVAILRNCRNAMARDGRLLIVEMVVPAAGEPHPAKMLDVAMLAVTGGMERTEKQYGELLDRAGFRLQRVIPTQSAVSVIEAVPTEQRA